jgi:hypothetical protein
MTREPSQHGQRRQPITMRDGTWVLPHEIVRERELAAQTDTVSGPVAALRAEPERASAAAPAFPRPPRPARLPGLAPDLQALWSEVLDRHDALARQDDYEVLGIPYESGGTEVAEAFKALIGRLHPDKLPSELELVQPYAVRLFARLNVAHMRLGTRRDRVAYLRSLGKPIPAPSSHPPPRRTDNVVARVRPERRLVPKPASGQPAAHKEPLRPKQASGPPSAGARLLRALRSKRPSAG